MGVLGCPLYIESLTKAILLSDLLYLSSADDSSYELEGASFPPWECCRGSYSLVCSPRSTLSSNAPGLTSLHVPRIAGDLSSLALPATLEDALSIRLSSLNEDEDVQRVLWLAAVLGGQFQMDEMRILWALRAPVAPDNALRAAMGKVLQQRVIVSRGSSGYMAPRERRRSSVAGSKLVYAFSHLKIYIRRRGQDCVVHVVYHAGLANTYILTLNTYSRNI